MQRHVVMLAVIISEGGEARLEQAVAALHGREFPGVPGSWVSRTHLTGPDPAPTGPGPGPGDPAPARVDGRTPEEASYEAALEDGLAGVDG